MKLVEVVKTDLTSDETLDVLMNFSKTIQKTPVACKVQRNLSVVVTVWESHLSNTDLIGPK